MWLVYVHHVEIDRDQEVAVLCGDCIVYCASDAYKNNMECDSVVSVLMSA